MPKATLPPLDQLDPAKAWEPWQPDAAQPWNRKWAGHLYRRAGFGAGPTQLNQAIRAGLAATLTRVLQGEPPTAKNPGEPLFLDLGEPIVKENEIYKLRGWWVYCMLNTPHPLHERMTLFWHNHFATSIAKVQRVGMMYNQHTLIRQHALGKFHPFLLEMSRDPAMLVWLDSNSNVKGKPNENYARELMELFSLGVGHYTEKDVREAARAFTGWHTNDDKYDFSPLFHDDGDKTILGQKGNWNGDNIVRIVLEQPAAALFLTRKLYRHFISETANPPDRLLQPLADAFRKSDYDITGLVKLILSSRHFFSAYAYRQRVKSPAEVVVGTIRTLADGLGGEPLPKDPHAPPANLANRMEAMGQPLFAPPNVKGWVGGRSWLNTATVLARHNFVQSVVSVRLNGEPPENNGPFSAPAALEQAEAQAQTKPKAPIQKDGPPAHFSPDPALDPARFVAREKVTDPDGIARVLADVHLQDALSPAAHARLKDFLMDGKPKGLALEQRIREASHAIMSMPEYQLA
jgi:uncharacterized protein (DUF1800 family)